MPEQCVVQFADMIRFGRDLDALSSLGANFQDAFSGVNVANKCSQLPGVIRLTFLCCLQGLVDVNRVLHPFVALDCADVMQM